MSRTKRDSKSNKKVAQFINTRLRPYLADKNAGSPKFIARPGRDGTVSRTGKLVSKNANRSRKKAARQQGKKQIAIETIQAMAA